MSEWRDERAERAQPSATDSTQPITGIYRLQLQADLGFAAAESLVPYLARLGVSHLYLSPVLQAVAGSQHGYDVLDHDRVSDELGGRGALQSLSSAAHRRGLGVVVDVVPNHMALVAPEHLNRPLWQVLRDGRKAATAHWFDVDWDALDGRIGLPILGRPLAECLLDGELQRDVLDDEPVLRYFDHVFPLAAGTEDGSLDDVLARQHYLLANWRDKATVLNYRRFFDVDQLIAIRVEEPDVFAATHRLLLELHASGVVDGFRIDHPDGLADPKEYLQRLHDATDGAWVVVEKILEPGERLPLGWATAGTTGYDAIREIQKALVDPAGRPALDAQWQKLGGDLDLHAVEERAKDNVVEEVLQPEVVRLTRSAMRALDGFPAERVRQALVELLVGFDVYRAYVRPGESPDADALARLTAAADRAKHRVTHSDLPYPLRAEIAELGEVLRRLAISDESRAADFVVRLQQTCGPVMAKGVEDTTFYRWHRLVALNEVGGDPGWLQDGGAEALHTWAAAQQAGHPLGVTTLSTHDTKRSEDVRARLLAATGDAAAFVAVEGPVLEAALAHGVDLPTAHLVWQTLAGAWPLSEERLADYLLKAVREAKQHTAWIDGDQDYERRVVALAAAVTQPSAAREAVEGWVERNAEATRATTLAAKLLQLLLPGIPDVYQGSELVTRSLVDPDNRRPVNYAERADRLARLDAGTPPRDLSDEKLLITSAALRLRREHPEWFGTESTYRPLPGTSECAVGFVRAGRVAVVATRWPHRVAAAGGWDKATVTLPDGDWVGLLSNERHLGGEVGCAELFSTMPVALLVRR